jgi:hypothetical protein
MTYRGRIQNGVVVLEPEVALPEGAVVVVTIEEPLLDFEGQPVDPVFLMGDLAEDMGMPDLAANIDHYLYGHPKVDHDK